jgi:site-specific DNA-cytosine methylase
MRVAVICEFSGVVRDAFTKRGHSAASFDLLETEQPGEHYIGDVTKYPLEFWRQFDLAVCHPPCTHLAVSGARWFKDKRREQEDALEFVRWLMCLPIPRIAIENPVSIISSRIRKPDQIIQPWQFGHGETKATCLWLKNLPPLEPTNIVDGRTARVHHVPPGPDRWKERSRTYQGIANAMAEQWGRAMTARGGGGDRA